MSASTTPSPPSLRRSRLPIAAAILAGVIVALGAAMFIYDHARRDRIANGVTIAGGAVGGVRVAGLSEAGAGEKIERDLISELKKPITVHSGSHRWTLSARQAGVT